MLRKDKMKLIVEVQKDDGKKIKRPVVYVFLNDNIEHTDGSKELFGLRNQYNFDCEYKTKIVVPISPSKSEAQIRKVAICTYRSEDKLMQYVDSSYDGRENANAFMMVLTFIMIIFGYIFFFRMGKKKDPAKKFMHTFTYKENYDLLLTIRGNYLETKLIPIIEEEPLSTKSIS